MLPVKMVWLDKIVHLVKMVWLGRTSQQVMLDKMFLMENDQTS